MSLQDWHSFGWLKPHKTSLNELVNLLAIADRDIADAEAADLSDDWKFGIAYNAVLKLCTMMLFASGFMPEKALAHYRTLMSIQFTLGAHRKRDAEYLDACRIKRNHVEYDYIEAASASEAKELLDFARELRLEVICKLQPQYPSLGIGNLPGTDPTEAL